MALTPGTRLGVYDITAQIGEGGMGQVFRATDTKLKRQVAIKILPPAVAADAERLARFQREAEVLASLNHPNIAAIYGLEESEAITAQIGDGGMGQVYRARDTKLDRDVAIKVLPEAFSQDVDRLARFQREAKTLASLNHPNIAGIYGLEESNGVRAIVMELVDGDDLSQRIARGAIPANASLVVVLNWVEELKRLVPTR